MKRISILGSTGSIGSNSLKIIQHLPDQFEVVALAAHSNIDLLEVQIKQFRPKLVSLFDPLLAAELKKRVPHVEVVAGIDGLVACAEHPDADLVLSATNGNIGLLPTLAAIKAKKQVALATKEVLVSAGKLVMDLAKRHGVKIIPVDSELTAIFQSLHDEPVDRIERVIITASGGPFRNFTADMLQNVTVEQALNHPNYRMGPKVTIDSSTLMNKGLELLEAHALFGVALDRIEIVVHPQQIIHGMVEFKDASIIAQMSVPDMLPPIQYALTYPARAVGLLPRFDFLKNGHFDFLLPDMDKFPCLRLAYEAGRTGGSMPCFMNAVNEVLVQRFIKQQMRWVDIASKLEKLMDQHKVVPIDSFDTVLSIEKLGRDLAQTV